jgi:hypothetical protein
MVYAAPHAYEYSAMKETGVRLNAETWAQVQSAMTAAGIDPTADNFPAFMAALAKASAK